MQRYDSAGECQEKVKAIRGPDTYCIENSCPFFSEVGSSRNLWPTRNAKKRLIPKNASYLQSEKAIAPL